MDIGLLVNGWGDTGLLEGLDDTQKIRMSMKFEILNRYLLNLVEEPDYVENYGNTETMIFPLLRKMCAEKNEDGTYTFYSGVNPIRLLEQFKLWWNCPVATDLRNDLSVYRGIDSEAELLSIYCEMAADLIRSDNYKDIIEEPIKPLKYIKKFRL